MAKLSLTSNKDDRISSVKSYGFLNIYPFSGRILYSSQISWVYLQMLFILTFSGEENSLTVSEVLLKCDCFYMQNSLD